MQFTRFIQNLDGSLYGVIIDNSGNEIGLDCEATHNHPHNNGRCCSICKKMIVNFTSNIKNELDPFCNSYPKGKFFTTDDIVVKNM